MDSFEEYSDHTNNWNEYITNINDRYDQIYNLINYNQFVNEEKGLFKNLLLSTMLSLGINSVDAQTIQQDSVKTEIVKDISNFNKSVIFTLNILLFFAYSFSILCQVHNTY